MGSREEQKQQLRERREAQEHADDAARRKRTAYLAGGIALLAIIVVGALVLVSQAGDEGAPVESGLFSGVQQDGASIGEPGAPVTVVEFADLQCPFCARFATDDFPGIVTDYVKAGDVRMELRLLGFVGPDSESARLVAGAAGAQDRIWPLAENVYANQGAENSGYLTDEFLSEQGADIAGLDIGKAIEEAQGSEAQQYATESDAAAKQAGVSSTPSFLVGPTGGEMKLVGADELRAAIDTALAQASG